MDKKAKRLAPLFLLYADDKQFNRNMDLLKQNVYFWGFKNICNAFRALVLNKCNARIDSNGNVYDLKMGN